jgi:hypothetical protein
MSRVNGDKSRFHRERKQNIQRRLRTKQLLTAAGIRLDHLATTKGAVTASAKKDSRA